MLPEEQHPGVEKPIIRKLRKRWALLVLLLIGYVAYSSPPNPPSSVFSDPAAEKRYFRNGQEGIVLHCARLRRLSTSGVGVRWL